MASTLCPYCSKFSHMTPKWGLIFDSDSRLRFAATCDNCGRILVAEGRGRSLSGRNAATTDMHHVTAGIAKISDSLSWLPLATEAPVIEDVPSSIARAASEAYKGSSIGNYMSAILMARTVIEATAKNKGIKSGTLSAKIDKMREEQLIRPAIAEQAHEVRYFGNDMAHGDIDEIPERVDAEEVLALMSEVLSEVFQGPARLQRLRDRRKSGDKPIDS
ncbi:DUF4145 domain-containing protein [Rothia sp. AR01]|uniref:DUF4145 domain-containing protein n=1 Tax=Rothia santali TaxID=2949643 RepID=A0A9X2HMU8_9MICC|nr:DUF4145 domain-containing protein [Rothia santali]MCP3427258.1 DUF4145 domain-containing protein [Rothia santali]